MKYLPVLLLPMLACSCSVFPGYYHESSSAVLSPYDVVASEPPTPRVQEIPPQPALDMVWVPGYWAWKDAWGWISGYWRTPPRPHATWIPGRWVQRPEGWRRVHGYWRLKEFEDPLPMAPRPPTG